MARCLNLTKTGEYAVAALSRLALESGGLCDSKPIAARVLARGQEIPLSFLVKILALCAKAGIIRSTRGAEGGFILNRPADEITLLSILEACEGDYRRRLCVFFPSRICEGPRCDVYCPLRNREEEVRSGLERVTLAEMADALGRHPGPGNERSMEALDGDRGRG